MRKKYCGQRTAQGDAEVAMINLETNEAHPLQPGFKYIRHSQDGFAWGYAGSGPAQLAFAILLDHFGDIARATFYYQDFKFRVIAGLPTDEAWELTSDQIERTLNLMRQERTRTREEGRETWNSIT